MSYCNIPSNCGHDAFLLDSELDDHGSSIQAFLQRLSGKIAYTRETKPHQKQPQTSIFFDSKIGLSIYCLIWSPKNSKILPI